MEATGRETSLKMLRVWFFFGWGFLGLVFFFQIAPIYQQGSRQKTLYYHCQYGACFRTQINSPNNYHNRYKLKHENLKKNISSIVISFTKCDKQCVEQKYVSAEFQILPRSGVIYSSTEFWQVPTTDQPGTERSHAIKHAAHAGASSIAKGHVLFYIQQDSLTHLHLISHKKHLQCPSLVQQNDL